MKKLILLPLLLVLTACGFQPMYGKHSMSGSVRDLGEKYPLNDIQIAMIEDRQGQILRNDLIDRFYRNGEPVDPRYTLSFGDLQANIRELDLTKSSEVTRAQILASIGIILTDNKTGEKVLYRSLSSVSSYNVLSSKFASRVTEDNARANALHDLARQIETQLMLYFDRDPEVRAKEAQKLQPAAGGPLTPMPQD